MPHGSALSLQPKRNSWALIAGPSTGVGALDWNTASASSTSTSYACDSSFSSDGAGAGSLQGGSQARLYAESLHCTFEQAAWLLSNHPELLNLSPEAAGARLSALAFTLGRSTKAALGVALKQPQLLTWKDRQLHERVAYLAAALQLPDACILSLVYIAPNVLLEDVLTLQENLKQATEALACSVHQLAAILRKHPRVLLLAPAALEARCRALQQQFGLPRGLVVKMARASPGLLTQSMTTLADKYECISKALDMRPSEVAQVRL